MPEKTPENTQQKEGVFFDNLRDCDIGLRRTVGEDHSQHRKWLS